MSLRDARNGMFCGWLVDAGILAQGEATVKCGCRGDGRPVCVELSLSRVSAPTTGTMTEDTKRDYKEVPTKDGDEVKADSEVVGLKPKMTLLNGITVIVGSIIGSGIFISPTVVLANTGSVGMSLIVWIISGLFSMVGAYCYAELGCMIQKTGADYAYIMVSFGPFLAFMRLWVECIIVRPCSQTIVALTFSIYIMKPFFPTCDPPDDSARLLAAVCICESPYLLCFWRCAIPSPPVPYPSFLPSFPSAASLPPPLPLHPLSHPHQPFTLYSLFIIM